MALIGLDIGAYAVKALLLEELAGGRAALAGLGLAVLEEAGHWPRAERSRAAAGRRARALLKSAGLPSGPVVSAFSDDRTVIKRLNLPWAPPDQLESVALRELSPGPAANPEEFSQIFKVLEIEAKTDRLEILFVAAPRRPLDEHLAELRAGGLNPAVIDLPALALFNAYEYCRQGRRENVALMDIGARGFLIVLVENGLLASVTTGGPGGRELTAALGDFFRVGGEAAEAIKIGAEPMAAENDDPAPLLRRAAGAWLEALWRAIADFQAEKPGYAPERVLFSGGQSLQTGLLAHLAEKLSCPAELFNPLSAVACDPRRFDPAYLNHIGPQMAVSFGLALRSAR